MTNYKLYKFNGEVVGACYETTLGTCFFGFKYPDNTDYANFKREINEGTAQLQDADGNLMTAEQAKDLVKELP